LFIDELINADVRKMAVAAMALYEAAHTCNPKSEFCAAEILGAREKQGRLALRLDFGLVRL
jgi:hypothetical protein